MNDKGFTKEQLAALKHGDEVALAYGRRYNAHWRVHRIERRTAAAQHQHRSGLHHVIVLSINPLLTGNVGLSQNF
jgi:hypothetical protein